MVKRNEDGAGRMDLLVLRGLFALWVQVCAIGYWAWAYSEKERNVRIDPSFSSRARLVCGFVLVTLLAGCGGNNPFVSSFRWGVTPNEQQITPGGQAQFNITIDSKTNINAPVALRVEGVPAGATATFNPQNLPDTANSSTLT